jgi:VIT1/CCC1 family predicted Fe2+/Mn2+ transporter
MRDSLRTGFSFGLTSGIITTLGLMVGLETGTNSRLAVLGGILTIAIADSFSDAMGIHIAEESEGKHTAAEVWESTIVTFLTKFFFALSFALPVIFLPLNLAIMISIVYGLTLLSAFSYFIARNEKAPVWEVVGEHLFIAVLVIFLTGLAGSWINRVFVG